jgi:hypothetical protein
LATYGFKLYSVALRIGNGRKDVLFNEAKSGSTWRYADHAKKILSEHLNLKVAGLPHLRDEIPSAADSTTEAIFSPVAFGSQGDHITFTVRHGRPSGHELALSHPNAGEAKEVDIKGLAPVRSYRAVLIAPEHGTVGVLAVESIAGACPATPIVKWLSKWSQDRADWELGTNEKTIPWYKLKARPLGDVEQLQRFLDHASASEIVLTKHAPSQDRKRGAQELLVKTAALTNSMQLGSREVVKYWSDMALTGESSDDLSGGSDIKKLASLVGPEIGEIDFDEAKIVMRDEGGNTKSISPSNLNDVFTYKLAEDVPPADPVLYAGIRHAVEGLSEAAKLELDFTNWPIPRR